MSGAGVVHYQLLHRPRSVPTALGPAPLVTSSTSDERTFTILCTVNTVPHTLKLVTVELICRQVLFTCICAELRVDCLGEADKVFFQKTMTLLYIV